MTSRVTAAFAIAGSLGAAAAMASRTSAVRRNAPPGRLPLDAKAVAVALKAFTATSLPRLGRAVHAVAVKSLLALTDGFVGAALVQLYARCGAMDCAAAAYRMSEGPDVVLATAVVSGFASNGIADAALSFFREEIVGKNAIPSPVTLISVLSVAAQLGNRRHGRECHAVAVKREFAGHLPLMNAMLSFYVSTARVGVARRLFETMGERDVVAWSCLINGIVQSGEPQEALRMYIRMIGTGSAPNRVTMVAVVKASALAQDIEQGMKAHGIAIKAGYELETTLSTALVDMYMKCSCCDAGMRIFDCIRSRDAVVISAVIGGLAQNNRPAESLALFRRTVVEGVRPDAVTMVKALSACTQSGILRHLLCLHGYLVTRGFDGKVFVVAALLESYCKCGSLQSAVKVFDGVADKEKDIVLWSSMIAGYGAHGCAAQATALFKRMVGSSVEPDGATFVSVLSACSHAGLVEEGESLFRSMRCVHGVSPGPAHYDIMVDMLSRAGRLEEALELIGSADAAVSASSWCALLAGCRMHRDAVTAEKVKGRLLRMNPEHAGYYNLLSGIYASEGRWEDVRQLKDTVRGRALRRSPGCSSAEDAAG